MGLSTLLRDLQLEALKSSDIVSLDIGAYVSIAEVLVVDHLTRAGLRLALTTADERGECRRDGLESTQHNQGRSWKWGLNEEVLDPKPPETAPVVPGQRNQNKHKLLSTNRT